jgi:rhamnosyltransferase
MPQQADLSKHSENYCQDVAAVLVTYNPDLDALHKSVQSVLSQVSKLYIVDNGSSNYSPAWLAHIKEIAGGEVHLLHQAENLGIGAAHNIGIKSSIDHGAKYILLLDQDSQVDSKMVRRLRDTYVNLNESGNKVAALGPQYCDEKNGSLSRFVKVGMLGFVQRGFDEGANYVEADFIISSGALIPVTALDQIGLMDESLFIDHVDTEWCFRAKSKGFKIFGVSGAVMTHSLGEQRREIWLLRKRTVSFHKPFRYYYIYRNSVLLCRRRYMPFNWKLADASRCIKMAILFGLLAENRLACLKMMWLGMVDGLNGVIGKRGEF